MKNRFVGHCFQNKPSISWILDLFDKNPSCPNFLTAVALSKRVWD